MLIMLSAGPKGTRGEARSPTGLVRVAHVVGWRKATGALRAKESANSRL
jgi:hypothetical protein